MVTRLQLWEVVLETLWPEEREGELGRTSPFIVVFPVTSSPFSGGSERLEEGGKGGEASTTKSELVRLSTTESRRHLLFPPSPSGRECFCA